MKRRWLLVLPALALALAGGWALRPDPFETGAPLTARDARQGRLHLLPPSGRLDRLPPGWAHRTFLTAPAADYRLGTGDAGPEMRCLTDGSGSILGRETDVALADFPMLRWEWRIDRALPAMPDEATRAGDDHPARFFLRFEDGTGARHAAEIIWSNGAFAPGDWKVIEGFHHLVAGSGSAPSDGWQAAEADLPALLRRIGGDPEGARLRVLAFFCDSDNTGGASDARFRAVTLGPR